MSSFDELLTAIEANVRTVQVRENKTSFTWVSVGKIVHAFRGRASFCAAVRLPKNWLKLGRSGAVCLGCSRALRERGLLHQILK